MMKLVRLVVIAVLMISGTSLAQGDWHIETVDSDGQVGTYSSIKLDEQGYPHISYLSILDDDLKYAYWTGSEWAIQTVDTEGGYSGFLDLDSSDYAHISYRNSNAGNLKYARWTGTNWDIQTVDTAGNTGMYTSIALDSYDHPHISYYVYGPGNLLYAHWTGSEWEIQTVDSEGDVGYNCTSITIDSDDHPHIAYRDESLGDLKYACWTGSEWDIQVVDSVGDVGKYPSIQLDSEGYPHISHYDRDNDDLRYARWTGDHWELEAVDTPGNMGWCTCLVLDSLDHAHISYRDCTYWNLKYAHWTGSYWNIQTVDNTGQYGGANTSIDLSSRGYPYITHYDTGINDLRIVWYAYLFHLLSPETGEIIETTTPELDWENTADPDHQSFTLWWGTDPDFDTFNEETGITDSQYQITSGIEDGDTIYWRVKSLHGSGECWAEEMDWCFIVDLGTGINVEPEGQGLILSDPYPLPASDIVTIACTLPEDGRAIISVYDLSGRRVATLDDGEFTAGRHEVSWNCSVIPSGVYLCRFIAAGRSVTKRLLVSR